MWKLAAALLGLLLAAMPGAAVAKDRIEPRAQALLACASVTPDEARLHCYDQSVAAMKQALDEQGLVITERTKPRAREGVVTAVGSMGNNRFWVELDSGDRWQLMPTTFRSSPPQTGVRAKLDKGPLGNYWFTAPGWAVSPAKYVRPRR